ncbi:MAG: uroporphyrinogen-III C-methyltransferase [Legionellaceae bacterium]|nr:uroporphyrinogen-III C-methyltransferase [Legionellaceae bacterium]
MSDENSLEVTPNTEKTTRLVPTQGLIVKGMAILALLLAGTALFYAYALTQKYQKLQNSLKHTSTLQAQHRLENTLQNKLQALEIRQQQNIAQLSSQLHKTPEFSTFQKQSQLLFIQTYLNLANIALQSPMEINRALPFLNSAENYLQALHDSSLDTLQQSIAEITQQIKQTPSPMETFQTLQTLVTQIAALPEPTELLPQKIASSVKPAESSTSSTWQKVMSSLKPFILIQHSPKLKPVEKAQQQQQSIFSLEMAEKAFLADNQAAYQQALQQTQTTLTQAYTSHPDLIKAILETLAQLKQYQAPTFSLEPSIQALENILSTQHINDSEQTGDNAENMAPTTTRDPSENNISQQPSTGVE